VLSLCTICRFRRKKCNSSPLSVSNTFNYAWFILFCFLPCELYTLLPRLTTMIQIIDRLDLSISLSCCRHSLDTKFLVEIHNQKPDTLTSCHNTFNHARSVLFCFLPCELYTLLHGFPTMVQIIDRLDLSISLSCCRHSLDTKFLVAIHNQKPDTLTSCWQHGLDFPISQWMVVSRHFYHDSLHCHYKNSGFYWWK